ncbi:helix-turn-helix transcriptional regulator [Amycolatopsis minnesotensis]|uniref:Helix-turn-helix transcriptional regulator n=1 Tax=Amycolatopsis minnesotensis TaxID=337894 RepID=A0ABN2SB18_9PSEU
MEELVAVRHSAALTGAQMAEAIGWSQARVSRIEVGRVRPSPADVTSWLTACSVTGDRRADLLELADQVAALTATNQEVDRRGFVAQQDARAAVEAEATEICIYQPKVVPGLLQTPDYTRHMLQGIGRGAEHIDESVAARAQRQTVLYDSTKTIDTVILESVLRWRPGPPPVSLGQLDRLLTIAELPSVSIGIVPDTVQEEHRTAHSFVLKRGLDWADVRVETLTREITLTADEELAAYDEMFKYQQSLAVYDDAAAEIIQRAAEHIRAL